MADRTKELERALTRELQLIANYTDRLTPDGWGFVVLLMPTNEPETPVLYVSNLETGGALESVENFCKDMRAGNAAKPPASDVTGGSA